MLEIVKREVVRLTSELEIKADVIEVWHNEAGAKQLRQAIKGIREMYQRIESEAAYLSVANYAHLHSVHPKTVLRWIATGQLEAVKGATGYRIPLNARRQKRPRLTLEKAS